MSARALVKVVNAARTVEGGGFEVRRPLPAVALPDADPFLLLDHFGPVVYRPGEAVGAPDHPHRGFETVTYLLEGEQEHRDSRGNHGRIAAGDVQWMTAGAGVVHSEMPSERMLREGGRAHGFQIWVNLPRKDKLAAPRYQDIPSLKLPVVEQGGARVKVIAGAALGASAVIDTHTPITMLHVTLQPGAEITLPIPVTQRGFAYVFQGDAEVAGRALVEGQLAVLGEGETVSLRNAGTRASDVLLLGGVPLREPVARYGPFVMNTKQEILQAFEDFENGRMGEIAPQAPTVH